MPLKTQINKASKNMDRNFKVAILFKPAVFAGPI